MRAHMCACTHTHTSPFKQFMGLRTQINVSKNICFEKITVLDSILCRVLPKHTGQDWRRCCPTVITRVKCRAAPQPPGQAREATDRTEGSGFIPNPLEGSGDPPHPLSCLTRDTLDPIPWKQSLRQQFIRMACTEVVLSGETRKGIRERKGKDLPRMWF